MGGACALFTRIAMVELRHRVARLIAPAGGTEYETQPADAITQSER
jgi:hypothetical protein